MIRLLRDGAIAVLIGIGGVPAAAAQPAAATIEQARALLAAGKVEAAIDGFKAVLRLDPANAAAHDALGSLFNTIGRYVEALPHVEAAVAAAPGNGRFRYHRGIVLAEHGRFTEAIADFDRAIGAHPEMTYAWLERGAARLALDDAGGAERDWVKAAERDPDLIWTLWYPATGDFVAGRFAEAASGFDRVAAAEPGFGPAQLWRTIAHGRAGMRITTPAMQGSGWPAPVLDFYRGAITAERLLALAGEDQLSGDRRRLGEALYFIGQFELIAGRRAAAADYFRRALAVDAPRHVWKISAERELRELGG